MSEKTPSVKTVGSLGFLDVLGLILVVLRFCGIINWHWGLVLIPLYPTMFFIAAGIILYIIGFIVGLFKRG